MLAELVPIEHARLFVELILHVLTCVRLGILPSLHYIEFPCIFVNGHTSNRGAHLSVPTVTGEASTFTECRHVTAYFCDLTMP